jgi:uncharacterized protein (TIGR00369 family)
MNLVADLPPGLTGLQQLRAMINNGGRAPIGDSLDFTLVDAGDGWAAFEGRPSLRAYNPIGTVHGGYAATLLDSACGCAGQSRLRVGQGYTSIELKVAFHKAMTKDTGLVRAEGRVVTMGRRVAFVEAKLTGADARLYASATSTLLVIDHG